MRKKFPDLDLVLVESGGDNLAATFSPELADLTIYVIDVAAGDKIPSKGGPGITRSDLLVHQTRSTSPPTWARRSTSWSATPGACAAAAVPVHQSAPGPGRRRDRPLHRGDRRLAE